MTMRKAVDISLIVAAVIITAYWVVWFTARDVVASDSRAAYVEFENAFPLADGLLADCGLLALWALRRRSTFAPLWLAATSGGAFYLCAMDVLYDLENGIYAKGAGGIAELVINVLTFWLGSVCAVYARRLVVEGGRPSAPVE